MMPPIDPGDWISLCAILVFCSAHWPWRGWRNPSSLNLLALFWIETDRIAELEKNLMTHTMTTDHAAIGVYSNHTTAEAAVRKLEQSNISLDEISIIGG